MLASYILDDGETPAKKFKKEKKKKKDKEAKHAVEQEEQQMDTSSAAVRNLNPLKHCLFSLTLMINVVFPVYRQNLSRVLYGSAFSEL